MGAVARAHGGAVASAGAVNVHERSAHCEIDQPIVDPGRGDEAAATPEDDRMRMEDDGPRVRVVVDPRLEPRDPHGAAKPAVIAVPGHEGAAAREV